MASGNLLIISLLGQFWNIPHVNFNLKVSCLFTALPLFLPQKVNPTSVLSKKCWPSQELLAPQTDLRSKTLLALILFVSFSLFKVLVWHSLPLLKPFSSCRCRHCGQCCSSLCCCLLVLAVCLEYWRVFSIHYTIRSWFRCGKKYLQVNFYLVFQWFVSIT